MKITAPSSAPQWAHDLAANATNALDNTIWPYVTRTAVLIADLPDPADRAYLWRKYFVSNGAGNRPEVISNGVSWRYMDGTAV